MSVNNLQTCLYKSNKSFESKFNCENLFYKFFIKDRFFEANRECKILEQYEVSYLSRKDFSNLEKFNLLQKKFGSNVIDMLIDEEPAVKGFKLNYDPDGNFTDKNIRKKVEFISIYMHNLEGGKYGIEMYKAYKTYMRISLSILNFSGDGLIYKTELICKYILHLEKSKKNSLEFITKNRDYLFEKSKELISNLQEYRDYFIKNEDFDKFTNFILNDLKILSNKNIFIDFDGSRKIFDFLSYAKDQGFFDKNVNKELENKFLWEKQIIVNLDKKTIDKLYGKKFSLCFVSDAMRKDMLKYFLKRNMQDLKKHDERFRFFYDYFANENKFIFSLVYHRNFKNLCKNHPLVFQSTKNLQISLESTLEKLKKSYLQHVIIMTHAHSRSLSGLQCAEFSALQKAFTQLEPRLSPLSSRVIIDACEFGSRGAKWVSEWLPGMHVYGGTKNVFIEGLSIKEKNPPQVFLRMLSEEDITIHYRNGVVALIDKIKKKELGELEAKERIAKQLARHEKTGSYWAIYNLLSDLCSKKLLHLITPSQLAHSIKVLAKGDRFFLAREILESILDANKVEIVKSSNMMKLYESRWALSTQYVRFALERGLYAGDHSLEAQQRERKKMEKLLRTFEQRSARFAWEQDFSSPSPLIHLEQALLKEDEAIVQKAIQDRCKDLDNEKTKADFLDALFTIQQEGWADRVENFYAFFDRSLALNWDEDFLFFFMKRAVSSGKLSLLRQSGILEKVCEKMARSYGRRLDRVIFKYKAKALAKDAMAPLQKGAHMAWDRPLASLSILVLLTLLLSSHKVRSKRGKVSRTFF